MATVIGVRFKKAGKVYYFDPNEKWPKPGDNVIVETARGLEFGEVVTGSRSVPDEQLTSALKKVVRIATEEDVRTAQINEQREQDAFRICQEKIARHKLDMKLVSVEYAFDRTKILFYFTADGRVDFRELVKDLAGVFRNRIELRQNGVRDETEMLGGIGICGRPYCCSQLLEDFQPVSTKMAKMQSLSLNPAKISGACGRLMCCLRYEQAAYEDLVKKVPKQGAFVETIDGYGTAVQVNLLRQTVKVRLDSDTDDSLHLYKANELCAVPGGRPKDGEEPPHVLHYVPEEPEEETDPWAVPSLVVPEIREEPQREDKPQRSDRNRRRRRKSGEKKPEPSAEVHGEKNTGKKMPAKGVKKGEKTEVKPERVADVGKKNRQSEKPGKATVKPVKIENKPESAARSETGEKRYSRSRHRRPRGGKPKTGAAE